MPGDRVLHGKPRVLDEALRPAVRVVQLAAGLTGSIALWWLGASEWWIPLPLAASFLAFEFFFWRRADRPISVTLGTSTLEVHDRLRDQHIELAHDEVRAMDVWHRELADGRREAVVRFSVTHGPEVALRVVSTQLDDVQPGDVDAAAMDELLGGLAGVLRAVVPLTAMVRQDFETRDALTALRAWAPPHSARRTLARLWRGEEPSLDLFGLHEGPHDAVLELDGETWQVRARDGAVVEEGHLGPGLVLEGRRRRTILLSLRDEEPVQDEGELPLWVLHLGAQRIAIPAPLVADQAPRAEAAATELHTSVPEGAAVVWHLLQVVPEAQRPAALRRAVRDSH